MIMKTLLIAFLMISSMSAQADVAAFIGATYQDVTTDINTEIDPQVNYKAGVFATFVLTDKLDLRYGLGYTVREFSASVGGVETNYKLHYADIPVSIEYKISDMISVYAGPQVAVRLKNDFDTGGTNLNPEDSKYLYMMYQAGVSFKFKPFGEDASAMGVDLYYESGLNSFMLRVPQTNFSTIGLNAVYWF